MQQRRNGGPHSFSFRGVRYIDTVITNTNCAIGQQSTAKVGEKRRVDVSEHKDSYLFSGWRQDPGSWAKQVLYHPTVSLALQGIL